MHLQVVTRMTWCFFVSCRQMQTLLCSRRRPSSFWPSPMVRDANLGLRRLSLPLFIAAVVTSCVARSVGVVCAGVISVHFADTWEYAVRKTGVEQHRLLPELPQLLPQQDNFAARLEALVALGSEAFPRETETHCEACEEGSAVEESPLQDEATEDTASLRRTAAAASRPPGLPHALKLLALRGKREAARAQPFGSSHSLLSPTAAEGKLAAEVCFLRLRGGAREEDCSGARMLRRWRRKMLCTTEQKDALSLLKQVRCFGQTLALRGRRLLCLFKRRALFVSCLVVFRPGEESPSL